MGTMKFVNGDDRVFVSLLERAERDPALAALLETLPPDEASGAQFTHHAGTDDEPQLFEVRFPPNTKGSSHAHDTHEIMVVVEGEARFGKQVYGPGSSVFIPRMTLYSFQAGPEGLTLLTFRPTKNTGIIFKDEFMARREQGGRQAGDEGTPRAGRDLSGLAD